MGKFEKKREPRGSANPSARRSKKKKKFNKNAIIITCAALAVVIIGVVIAAVFALRDDGRIAANVYVAGVDLGGMTKEEAATALSQAVGVYAEENMNIELYTRDIALYSTKFDPENVQLVDIFGKPMDPNAPATSQETGESESDPSAPTESENTEPESSEPESSEPTEPIDAPLDENGEPMLLLEQICLTPSDTQVSLDIDKAVEAAYAYGRSGGIFSRLKKNTITERLDLDVSEFLTLDKTYVMTLLEQYALENNSEAAQSDVKQGTKSITDEEGNPMEAPTLEVTLPIPARNMDIDALYDALLLQYCAMDFTTQYAFEEDLPEAFDLDALYSSYCTAPVNAVCDEDTYDITDGKLGYGFNMAEAVELFQNALPGEVVTLVLGDLEPMYTREKLEAQLFSDVLSYYDSPHTNDYSRTNNLTLASKAIDGTILKPGEIFSFNDVVGQRTSAKGYTEGLVYVGVDTVPEIGGGICQVASTIYYCTLKADLEVIERTEHRYAPTYVPYGMDATIYWGSLDYQFRNNTAYPIRIEASVSGGYVHIKLVGTETKDYTVMLDYIVTSSSPWETKTIEISPDMDNYEKYSKFKDGDVISTAYTGYTIETYMYKYDANGNEISCTFIDYTKYHKRDKEIAKLVEETESTDPTIPTESTEPPSTDPTEPPSTDPTDPPTEPPTDPVIPPDPAWLQDKEIIQ
ncbi:MAG: VanW family protein [Oscillospiraceae bacterium]|jgi:vancomycin resistance protein YoaR|nr:VanW family protein [Oscillospiraceae bacterium]